MNLHEYQAKDLFAQYGISVPPAGVAASAQEALSVARALGGSRWVVKAQVHAGGRGKAGGIKLVDGLEELERAARDLLGTRLRTAQTAAEGKLINRVLIEQPCDIGAEFYLGALVDRTCARVVFMASSAGGMDIEEVAARQPERIVTIEVNPVAGLQPYQCRRVVFGLGLDARYTAPLTRIMDSLYRLFMDQDLSLVEINPLVLTTDSQLLALDAKINLDDNALYRHKALSELRDPSQEDEREYRAQQHGLNYISLDGNIACMVNGAGLAMATMDLIKLHGGEPANFLDVGGGTTADKVAEAFKIIVSDDKVEAILVNIFGGIVRCDLIAEGIVQAIKEVNVAVPVVVRLEGTNAEQGRELLQQSGLALIAASDLTDAASKVVAASRGQ
ncbi:MAG: succinyl-CoA synthetase subunit beta [Gammaproteobacteria bacterium SG8_47]|nr:MAG: succinyl-CoA synthetase subunit beta [Gammaproteobacteria bacterium SG8_47]